MVDRPLSTPVPWAGDDPAGPDVADADVRWPPDAAAGKRRVEIMQVGRAHTAGDTIVWVPDAGVMFSGDIVEYRSACYCGGRPSRRLAAYARPDRGVQAQGAGAGAWRCAGRCGDGARGARWHAGFRRGALRHGVGLVAHGRTLKETHAAWRSVMDPKFSSWAIYEHCLPFNVSRAFDEASAIEHPRIWTAERDRQMWGQLQG